MSMPYYSFVVTKEVNLKNWVTAIFGFLKTIQLIQQSFFQMKTGHFLSRITSRWWATCKLWIMCSLKENLTILKFGFDQTVNEAEKIQEY